MGLESDCGQERETGHQNVFLLSYYITTPMLKCHILRGFYIWALNAQIN